MSLPLILVPKQCPACGADTDPADTRFTTGAEGLAASYKCGACGVESKVDTLDPVKRIQELEAENARLLKVEQNYEETMLYLDLDALNQDRTQLRKQVKLLRDATKLLLAAVYVGDGKVVCPPSLLDPVRALAAALAYGVGEQV